MGKGGGGSGGGGASSGTQETIQREAPGVESRKLALYDEAVKLAQQPVSIPAYQVAGPTGLEQTGFQQAAVTGVGQPTVGQGIAGLQAGQQATGAGLLAGQQGTGLGVGAAFAGPNISQFFNPYQSYVTDEINRQAQIAQNQQAAQAVSAGAFGGGREGVQRAELDRARLEAIGQSQAQGFNTALQAAQQQQGLQAQTGLQAGQQLGQMGLQAGAQFGQLGQALTGVGAQQQAMQQADIQSLLQAGGVQRALGQQALEAQRATSLAQQYEPYQRVEFLKNVMTNLPTGQSSITATTAPGSNPLAQAAGAGLGAYTAYSLLKPRMKEGGLVSIKKYQNGGEVKPTPKKQEGAFSDEERFALLAAPVIGSLLEGRTAPGQSNLQALFGSVGKGVSQMPEVALQIKKLDIAAQPKETKAKTRDLTPEEIKLRKLGPVGTIAQEDAEGNIKIISKPSDKELEQNQLILSNINAQKKIMEQYEKLGKPVGPFYNLDPQKIGGFFSSLVGGETGAKLDEFNTNLIKQETDYVKLTSGLTVSDKERANLEKFIQKKSDTESVFEAKGRALNSYYQDLLKIQEAQGLSNINEAAKALEAKGISILDYAKKTQTIPNYKADADGKLKLIK